MAGLSWSTEDVINEAVAAVPCLVFKAVGQGSTLEDTGLGAWCADDRALDQLFCSGRGVRSFANCDSGLPICIEAAVLVANETFMSRVEKVKDELSSENGDESACCGCNCG